MLKLQAGIKPEAYIKKTCLIPVLRPVNRHGGIDEKVYKPDGVSRKQIDFTEILSLHTLA